MSWLGRLFAKGLGSRPCRLGTGAAAQPWIIEHQTGLPVIYQLRVEEHLDTEMAAWFAPLQVVNQPNGVATLTGPVVDQAALHGMLNKVFNLNLTLLAVTKLEGDR